MWLCPSCSQKQLNWFNKTWVVLLTEWMCIKHFCQMVLIPVLHYCQHTVMLLLYMFMVATLDVTLVWYLHICLGLETFPVRWLRHWPNTGSPDPEQIADTRLHILLKCREQTVLSNILQGKKCSCVYSNCPQQRFPFFWSVTTLKATSSHDPSSLVGKSLLRLFHLDNFRWLKR